MKDLAFGNRLKFVQISISTSTFDNIKKDRAAKFVDQLSTIGGTMGLLTGFSLISAVEILYFAVKIAVNIMLILPAASMYHCCLHLSTPRSFLISFLIALFSIFLSTLALVLSLSY